MSVDPTPYELAPVKFSRLSKLGIILGLSLGQLVILGVGAFTLVVALYATGGAGLVISTPVLVICAALAWGSVGGRRIVAWLPITTIRVWRTRTGQREFRRRVIRPRPAGTLALPGDAASLRQWHDEENRRSHDPRPPRSDTDRDHRRNPPRVYPP